MFSRWQPIKFDANIVNANAPKPEIHVHRILSMVADKAIAPFSGVEKWHLVGLIIPRTLVRFQSPPY